MEVVEHTDCFVYQVLQNEVTVRSRPTTTMTTTSEEETTTTPPRRKDGEEVYRKGDLVCGDLLMPTMGGGSANGPFLRLADATGWLFERKNSKAILRRLPVQSGLWTFAIDNYPSGIALRRQPIDRPAYKFDNFVLLPMQKIYCDLHVVHPETGVRFYKVQGTNGWIFDRRLLQKQPSSQQQQQQQQQPSPSFHPMLLPEAFVQRGLFAFRVLSSSAPSPPAESDTSSSSELISIRNRTTMDDFLHNDGKTFIKTRRCVRKDDIVFADILRETPLDKQQGNGPFIRLIDGTGWLFQKKNHRQVLEAIPIQEGRWTCAVSNAVSKLPQLTQQPQDYHLIVEENAATTTTIRHQQPPISSQQQPPTPLSTGQVLLCDRKITSKGISYLRVQGTACWIHDKELTLEGSLEQLITIAPNVNTKEVSSLSSLDNTDGGGGCWSVDYVRGMATAVGKLVELHHRPEQQLVAFTKGNKKSNNLTINVYYAIQMIVTIIADSQRTYTHCTHEHLLEIFKNPRKKLVLMQGKKKNHPILMSTIATATTSLPAINKSVDNESATEKEEEVRRRLMECGDKIRRLQEEQRKLMRSIQSYDEDRTKEAQQLEKLRLSQII